MYYVFYKTNDVFIAEEILKNSNIKCKVVPTPVQDKAYCGVCIMVNIEEVLVNDLLKELEYKIVFRSGVK